MKKFLNISILLFISTILLAQNGPVKSYYPDHKLKSELSYVNDILDGPAVWYYQNGKVMLEKNYSKGIMNGWVREYYENGQLKSEFNVKTGVKDGDEKKYFENGNLNEILSYADGKLQNSQTFEAVAQTNIKNEVASNPQIPLDSKNKLNQLEKNDLEKKSVNATNSQGENSQAKDSGIITQPVIVGGINEVTGKIVYPDDALKFGLEGTVTIKATIDENGNVDKTEIVKGLGLGCNEAAIKIVKQAKYNPATKNGQPIEGQLLIDVPFKLPVKKQEIAKEEVKSVEAPKQERKYEENLSVICEADRCPRPEDDIATIYSLFQIPNVAKALKLRGMILIEGMVDKNGKFSQTKIIEGVGYGCDQLVETALQKSKFTPGMKKGEPVETKALINFPFSYDR